MADDLVETLITDALGGNRSRIRRRLAEVFLSDTQVLRLVARTDAPSLLLEEVLARKEWGDNIRVRSTATRNPKTPLHVSLRQLKYLGIMDLLSLLRDMRISPILRRKVEEFLVEKIPGQPLGIKKSLARLGRDGILRRLLQEVRMELAVLCLNNPFLTEGHLYRVIFHDLTSATTIRMVASHPRWRIRYNIRLALLRNRHTPLQDCVGFLPDVRPLDLRDALVDKRVHVSVRLHIKRLLLERSPPILHSGNSDPETLTET